PSVTPCCYLPLIQLKNAASRRSLQVKSVRPIALLSYIAELAGPARSAFFDDRVDQTVLHRFTTVHKVVPVSIALYLVQTLTHTQDFAGMDVDVGRLTLKTAHRLVHHHARMWQRKALAGSTARQE